MIIRDERDKYDTLDFDYEQHDHNPPKLVSLDHPDMLAKFIHNHLHTKDNETHFQLQSDLVEHLWQVHGES
jgi:hypothetical protein